MGTASQPTTSVAIAAAAAAAPAGPVGVVAKESVTSSVMVFNRTLKQMIADGAIQPGVNVLSVNGPVSWGQYVV